MKKGIYTIIGMLFTQALAVGATWVCCSLWGVPFAVRRGIAVWIALYCIRAVVNY